MYILIIVMIKSTSHIPEYIKIILKTFAENQADSMFRDIVPSMNDTEILELNAGLLGNSTYFRDHLSTLIDVDELKTILSQQFSKIRKEPLDSWNQILAVLKYAYSKRILPKLNNKIKEMQNNKEVSLSQVIESLIKYSDEF